ncbi:MAG: hypothetical protein A2Z90_10900 [Burkholderiales bacterium GWA2_64_37]|nr:MAG: hypothetical protein A2Z90_10900 [Burkholderiales bacterium GWA2_64_37]HCE94302.1 hypothetical protein [Acidovorax sp.]
MVSDPRTTPRNGLQKLSQFGGAIAALIPLAVLVSFSAVVWRTVSLHSLLRRAWVLGSQEISDPTIRAYVEEQANLMSFRMFLGVCHS